MKTLMIIHGVKYEMYMEHYDHHILLLYKQYKLILYIMDTKLKTDDVYK